MLCRAALHGTPVTHTEVCDRGLMYRNKDRSGYVGALKIAPRMSISPRATASDDDPVREMAETGIQVSKGLFY